MEITNEIKTEEKIEVKETPNIIENRKGKLKNFFFGWVKDNYDKIFIGVLVLAFALRIWIFVITKNQAMWFDEAEYMSTAKYWAGISHMTDVWYYRRGFFWPLFCSFFFKIGLGEMTIRFVTVLFSTGIVAVSYFLIRDMFNKKYALFASIGLAFSWVILFFTGRPSTEIPASFFLLLSLFFFWKGYGLKQGNKFIYLFAFFLAISVLTRMQNLMFIPMFFVFIFIKEKFAFLKNKQLWIALLVFILVLIPLFIVYNQHFGNPLADIMSYDLGIIKTGNETVTSKGNLANLPMYLIDLPYNLTVPILILFLIGALYFFMDIFLGFDKIFKNENIQKKIFIFLWILLPLLILGYVDSYAQQRYTIMQHPFFFMIAAIPFFEVGKLIEKHSKINKKIITILILMGFIAALIPNLVWANQLTENKKTSYQELKWAGEWIKENSNLNDIVITSSFPQISYYSERRTTTFEDCYNNPEAHNASLTCSKEEFYEFVEKEKPKFMILSVFEEHPEWVPKYLQEYNNTWFPVQGYKQGEQTILVVYGANYK
jgi:hypothetical protein